MAETRFVAKALVIDSGGSFLRLTRSDSHPSLAGLYDLPGGTVEPAEEPAHAVVREIFEETGLAVDAGDVKVLYATTLFIGERSFPTLLYLVRLHKEQPVVALSYEHKDAQWRPFEELQEVEPHIAPTYREALQYLRRYQIIEDI